MADDRSYREQIKDAVAHLGTEKGRKGVVSRALIAKYVCNLRFGTDMPPKTAPRFWGDLRKALDKASHGVGAELERINQSFRLRPVTLPTTASSPEWMKVRPRYVYHPQYGKCRVLDTRANGTVKAMVAPSGSTYTVDRNGNCTLTLVYVPLPATSPVH